MDILIQILTVASLHGEQFMLEFKFHALRAKGLLLTIMFISSQRILRALSFTPQYLA